MERRTFLQIAGLLGGASAFGAAPLRNVLAAGPADAFGAVGPRLAQTGPGPYGALQAADANGLQLPAGFTSRVIAVAGQKVGSTQFVWKQFPDGGATFATAGGGWIYVCNSEVPTTGGGGAQAVRFAADGTIISAYSILDKSTKNCAGGRFNGKWLSCEEYPGGMVWECNPFGGAAIKRPALGTFQHEAAVATSSRLYLTEDNPEGRFYRFTPTTWPNLASGKLEVMKVTGGAVTWLPVPNPNPIPKNGDTPTRLQVPTSTAFNGGEGICFTRGKVYFTTKGDQKLWEYNPTTEKLQTRYAYASDPGKTFNGPDNLTASGCGDIYACEDPGNVSTMDLVLIEPDGTVSRFCTINGQTGSELTGVAINPAGTRLYFSSQRANTNGITYEVTGPFRTACV